MQTCAAGMSHNLGRLQFSLGGQNVQLARTCELEEGAYVDPTCASTVNESVRVSDLDHLHLRGLRDRG